jgi:hypothetical protein
VRRLLGLELTATELRIARAERRLGATRLVSCGRVTCATADDRRAVLASALAWRPHVVVAALPVAALAHRVLVLPFRDARRIAETVPLELVGQLPADPGDVVTGHLTLEAGDAGTRVLAAVARRAHVVALADALADAGARPTQVDAALVGAFHLLGAGAAAETDDTALLLLDGARSALAVRRHGRLAGLRALSADPTGDPAAFDREVRWTLAALGGASQVVALGADASPERSARIGGAIGAAVVAIDAVAAPPWRGDDLGPCAVAAALLAGPGLALHRAPEATGSVRRIRTLAAAAMLLAVADVALVRSELVRRDAALVAAVRATAAAALPPGTRVVAPRAQLEAAAGAVARRPPAAGAVLALLREISARVPTDVGLDLDELALDGDVLRLHGRTDRFESIDVLTRALGTSALLHDVTTEDSRAAIDGRGVEFGLRATWRPAVGAPS